ERVDAGDLRDDRVGVVAELHADVLAGADAHAVVVAEDGGAGGERAGELAVDVDDRDPGLHGLRRDVRERGAVERQEHDRVDAVVDEALDLADLDVDVVRAVGDAELDVLVLLGLGLRRARDGTHPAVVGGGGGEADDDRVARGVVVGDGLARAAAAVVAVRRVLGGRRVRRARRGDQGDRGRGDGRERDAATEGGACGHGISFDAVLRGGTSGGTVGVWPRRAWDRGWSDEPGRGATWSAASGAAGAARRRR